MSNPVLPIDPKLLVKEERILWAAIKVFSQYPFSVATVKMIADEAELPLSAVMYHHKSKENLYEAVFDRLVPYYEQAQAGYRSFLASPEKADRKAAWRVFEEYLCDAVDGFYDEKEKNWYLRIMLSESLYPSPIFETIYEKHFVPHIELLLGLIKASTGDDDQDKAMLNTTGIMGYLLSFRIFREFVIRQTSMECFEKEEIERIKALVIHNIKLILEIEE